MTKIKNHIVHALKSYLNGANYRWLVPVNNCTGMNYSAGVLKNNIDGANYRTLVLNNIQATRQHEKKNGISATGWGKNSEFESESSFKASNNMVGRKAITYTMCERFKSKMRSVMKVADSLRQIARNAAILCINTIMYIFLRKESKELI